MFSESIKITSDYNDPVFLFKTRLTSSCTSPSVSVLTAVNILANSAMTPLLCPMVMITLFPVTTFKVRAFSKYSFISIHPYHRRRRLVIVIIITIVAINTIISSSVILTIKSKEMRWVRHVACMQIETNVHKFSVYKF
jgi:hypothetical protein